MSLYESGHAMSLIDMIDLSLGIESPGEIHFRLLHQVLCAIVQNLNLGEITVQPSIEMDKVHSSAESAIAKHTVEGRTPSFDTMIMKRRVENLEETTEKLVETVDKIAEQISSSVPEGVSSFHSLSDLKNLPIYSLGNRAALDLLAIEVRKLQKLVIEESSDKNKDERTEEANLNVKINALNVRVKQCMDQIECLDSLVAEQIMTLGQNYSNIEKKVDEIDRTMKAYFNNDSILDALHERSEKMDKAMIDMKNELRRVLDQEEERVMHMSCLIEQLEYLKICKVDKEDFFDDLEKKLDKKEIDRKLSKDKFEAAHGNLKEGLDETISKLSNYEAAWQRAMIDLQFDVATKLDKKELKALKIYIRDKLKNIQDQIRAIRSFQKKHETAASRQELITNLNCLACDNEVNMRPKQFPEDYPKTHVLPSTKTIAPFVAYEIEKLRKLQRGAEACRNLQELENSIQKSYQMKENRFCGGLHTITTPTQRISKQGNFMEQWGPDLVPSTDVRIKGKDNNMYVGEDLDRVTKPKKNSMIVDGNLLQERSKTVSAEKDNNNQKDAAQSGENAKKNKRVSLDKKIQIYEDVEVMEKPKPVLENIFSFSFDDDLEGFPDY